MRPRKPSATRTASSRSCGRPTHGSNDRIHDYEHDTDHANTQHTDYELAEVGLQVGIVLATVSIIARRRWLLAAGGAAATAGVLLLLVGLLAW